MSGRYRHGTLMALLLIVSELGLPPPDSNLARSVRETDAANHATFAADSNVIATLMTDSTSTVTPGAIERLIEHMTHFADLDALYGDSDVEPDDGTAILRPAWSPLRLMTMPTDLDHLIVRGQHLSGSLSDRIHALTRIDAGRIGHVPDVLVRIAGPPDLDTAAREALDRAAEARSVALEALRPDRFGLVPAKLEAVSIIIPTAATTGADGRPLVENAITACLATEVDELEVLLVVGDECQVDPAALTTDPRVQVVRRPPGNWNFSAAINLGILRASHPTVLVLNDDVELVETDWIARMASHLADPTVGAVGALLLYPDLTCQHVGMVTDDAFPLHPHVGRTIEQLEAFDADLAHDRIAVTAACLLARRADLLAVGGFCEELPFGFNDVDLCFKLHRMGLRIVVEPRARLIHFESASRPPVTRPWEWDHFVSRWGDVVDPWYHPAYHRPDDPNDRRRNADHLAPIQPYRSLPRTAVIRSRVHHARLRATNPADGAS
jgi:GT2 family glycosyltransferase